jgi:alpha-tubulin suppressor-like RCC1 family protein
MTVNIGSFVFTLAKKIEATTDPLELTVLTKAVAKLKGGTINSVYSFSLLPTITSSIYGDLYLVESEKIIYWAHPTGWMSLGVIPQVNQLYGWGRNDFGQVGDGTAIYRSSPTLSIVRQGGWRKLGTARCVGAAIKNDGTLWVWGRNLQGQLGTGDTTAKASPTTTIGGGTTWCTVADGSSVSSAMAAIKTDGTIWTWGYNGVGTLGDGTTTNRSSPGTIAGGGTNWCSAVLSCNTVGALKTDGTLWTWGCGGGGILGNSTTTNRSSPGTTAGGGTTWCQIGQESLIFSAIKTDGTLWTWGSSFNGELGDNGTMVSRSSPGTTAGGGTIWCFSAGKMGIKTDGTLWTWGGNGLGQLGDGTTVNRSSPVITAGGGTTWRSGSSSTSNAAGIKTDGTLWTWGYNKYGLLATGNCVTRSSPGTTIGGGTTWFCISLGSGEHALALTCE